VNAPLAFFLFVAVCLPVWLGSVAGAEAHRADVIVYGGTSAAITAAVQVRQMGKTVIVVSPDQRLGGLSSGGLGWTDSGKKEVIGGLARDFYHRVYLHYDKVEAWRQQQKSEYGGRGQGSPAVDGVNRTMWIFEPSVAEGIFEDYVRENELDVRRGAWLDRSPGGVEKEGSRITAIHALNGDRFEGAMFLDATYEGDLLAAAGASYHVGREANSVYGENWNGIQVGVLHHSHWFQKPVDPYRTPGDPDSGLLPHVSGEDPGEKGQGDHRVQAYCFRMCLTNAEENRIPFPRPEGYDPAEYELLLRVFDTGWRDSFRKFDPLPNFKTDTNNHGPFSTDMIGASYAYPEASYEERAEIIDRHRRYQQGYMYFVANDPRVPTEIRERMATWGLPKDEFTDHQNWSPQLYVREARRLVGHYVMTEHDCLDAKETPASVGMGSYTLDSHNVQRYVKPDGSVQNEGDIGVKVPRPYEVSYGSLCPKREECTNLLVPVCVSSSHIAFGSIRMEPVFMILGQSAATAAVQAIERNEAVQDLPYAVLRERLLADGQVLEFEDPTQAALKAKGGLLLDDSEAKLEGEWSKSTSLSPYVGVGYLHDGAAGDGLCTARFEFKAPKTGRFSVEFGYVPSGNRASNLEVVVEIDDARHAGKVDQRKTPPIDGLFVSLGEFDLREGELAAVTLQNQGCDGHVIVDGLRVMPVGGH